jgi:hypothetical protein
MSDVIQLERKAVLSWAIRINVDFERVNWLERMQF